jgi:prepilin-type N-terminal cleavage/methylation domain-containing protein
MQRRRTNGFTLIEMLVVLVIAGILISLAVPAVTSLMSSGGLSAASREVANTLGLARQVAITQRTYARVVFPYSGTGSQPAMWYRTYAVMTNRYNTVAGGWTYMTKWEYLPLGAVFLDNNHSTASPPPNGALDDPNSLSYQPGLPFPIPGNPGNLAQLAYIEVGPTGVATPLNHSASGALSSTLAITEGFTTTNNMIATVTPTASKTITNTLANLTTISVDTLVGRIQVVRP